jgi:hypothetical protein
LPISLDCSFLISPSVFSNVNFLSNDADFVMILYPNKGCPLDRGGGRGEVLKTDRAPQ